MNFKLLSAGSLALVLPLAAPVFAAESPAAGQSILVLDASGSMWGQVGGKTKVEIAREAVAAMLATWPEGEQLGLIAYGHRRKGDCADIEVISQPRPLDKASFTRDVNALQAKGMTPITASVRLAAEQLKFTEQKATVILVSDGEETCKADPCALGKELEMAGVDFTAHVVGFDLPQGPARAQLQCLASSTGGTYTEARNAGELNRALGEIAQAPAAPALAKVEDPWFNEGCTLFDQPNYQGNRYQLGGANGLQLRNVPDGWGTRMQSVHCQPGCTVLVFTEPEFYGQSWGIDRSYPNKSPADGWEDWHVLGSTEVGCSAVAAPESP